MDFFIPFDARIHINIPLQPRFYKISIMYRHTEVNKIQFYFLCEAFSTIEIIMNKFYRMQDKIYSLRAVFSSKVISIFTHGMLCVFRIVTKSIDANISTEQ